MVYDENSKLCDQAIPPHGSNACTMRSDAGPPCTCPARLPYTHALHADVAGAVLTLGIVRSRLPDIRKRGDSPRNFFSEPQSCTRMPISCISCMTCACLDVQTRAMHAHAHRARSKCMHGDGKVNKHACASTMHARQVDSHIAELPRQNAS